MFSVVVPTFNRAHMLSVTLESLLAQKADFPYEIVVVDNNSSDDTRSVVQSFEQKSSGRLRYVFEGKQGLSAARNAGIGAARGELVAFVDDDVIAKPGWLQALATTYRAFPDAWCVGGRIALGLPETCPSWFDVTSEMMTGYLSVLDYGDGTIRLKYPFAPYGANFSVKREAFSCVGVFDTRLGRSGLRLLCGEEIDLCLRIHRAGGGVYYCSEAIVTHLVPCSRLTKHFSRKRAYWQGRTDAILWPRDDWHSSARNFGSGKLALVAKEWAKALTHYVRRDPRQAFEHEIAAWKWLGYLQQSFLHEAVQKKEFGDPRP